MTADHVFVPGVSDLRARRNPKRAYKLAMRVRFIGWLDYWMTDAMSDPRPSRRVRRLFHLACLCRALGMRDKCAQIIHDAPLIIGRKEAILLHKADCVARAHDYSGIDHDEYARRHREKRLAQMRERSRQYDAVPEHKEARSLRRAERRNA